MIIHALLMFDIKKIHADIDRNINVGTTVVTNDVEQCKRTLQITGNNSLRILTQNIRSINRNFDELTILLQQLDIEFDIIILTECWLSKVHELPILLNFKSFSTARNVNKNDGVAMYIRKSLRVTVTEPQNTNEITCLIACLKDTNIIGAYRPPEFIQLDKFIQSLESILNDFKQSNLILMGDLNIDIKDGCNSSKCDSYLELLAMHGLTASHNYLTTGKSCLDHCFIKSKLPIVTVVYQSTITDHSSVIISLLQKEPTIRSRTKYVKKINYIAIHNQLKCIDWNELLLNLNADEATQIFLNTIINTINSNTINIKLSSRKRNIKAWITPGLIRCIRHKDRLHSKSRKDPNNIILKISYIRYRNTCRKVLNAVKRSFYRNKLKNNKHKTNVQWDCIKEVCNLKKEEHIPLELLELTHNPKESINQANLYFANVGETLANEILDRTQMTESKLLQLQSQSNGQGTSFYLHPTDKYEVANITKSLKNTNSCGWDGITSLFFKKYINILAEPIASITNTCFQQGIFPNPLKKTIIIPKFKSGKKHEICNYRPISLLPTLSKIIEKIINNRLKVYLTKNNILALNQFGFQNNKSTSDALKSLTSNIINLLDNRVKCMGIFLDLKKAFDTVSVPLLLKKLENVGVRGLPHQLFTSYLTNRKQMLSINNLLSDETNVKYGVPQGSTLGPTLFLIYINELCLLRLEHTKVITFADDTVLISQANSSEEVYEKANKDFNVVMKWLDNNLLSLNIDKTKYIKFSIREKKNHDKQDSLQLKAHYCRLYNYNLICNCQKITQTHSLKYLGVVVDQHLCWKEHINLLYGRLKRLISIFKSIRYICDYQLLRSIYFALCNSLISYGIIVWGGANKTLLLKIERAQRAIFKVMFCKDYSYPTDTLYKELAMLNVRQTYLLAILKDQHKNSIVRINTHRRRQDLVYQLPTVKTAFARKFYLFLAPYIYNKISKSVKLKNLNNYTFKKTVDKYLKALTYNDTEKIIKPI